MVLGERPLVSLNADPLIFLPVLTSSFICSPRKSVPHNRAGKHGAAVGKSGDAKERQLEDNAGNLPEKIKDGIKNRFPYFHSARMWLPSNDEYWLCARWSKRVIEGSLCDCWWSDAKHSGRKWDTEATEHGRGSPLRRRSRRRCTGEGWITSPSWGSRGTARWNRKITFAVNIVHAAAFTFTSRKPSASPRLLVQARSDVCHICMDAWLWYAVQNN